MLNAAVAISPQKSDGTATGEMLTAAVVTSLQLYQMELQVLL
jgi:hypothetical protein